MARHRQFQLLQQLRQSLLLLPKSGEIRIRIGFEIRKKKLKLTSST
jgi:hypothetical protein